MRERWISRRQSRAVFVFVCVFRVYPLWPVAAVACSLSPSHPFRVFLCSLNKNQQRHQNKQLSRLTPHTATRAFTHINTRAVFRLRHYWSYCNMRVILCVCVCECVGQLWKRDMESQVKEQWLNYLNGCCGDYWGQWASISFNTTSLECTAKEGRSRDIDINKRDRPAIREWKKRPRELNESKR